MPEYFPLRSLKGIGEKTEKLFAKLRIHTVQDLLAHYPRDYDTYEPPVELAMLEEGRVMAVAGTIQSFPQLKKAGKTTIVSYTLRDRDYAVVLTWFNMPFLKSTLRRGSRFIFRGMINQKKGKLVMDQPQMYTPAAYQELLLKMQPLYPLTAGLTNQMVVKAVKQSLDKYKVLQEFIPSHIREQYELAEYNYALHTIHFPQKKEELIFARKRLVFDEFFLFIIALRQMKDRVQEQENNFLMQKTTEVDRFLKELPYELTDAQKKVWTEIEADLLSKKVMARLIQGDVGSGKTIVAVLALLMAAQNGFQGALMVPTEVLAKQHFESISEYIEKYNLPVKPILLTGSMKAREKRGAYEAIGNQDVNVIIGTHALIQEKVVYKNLALVITDEQHRFGVKQREHFAEKGHAPHVLVMSATPIPRTLAIILYGDLDISVIDQLPASRLPIKNCVVDTHYRPKAYSFIQKQVEEGRQAYVICAMVEESEAVEAENVMDYSQVLKDQLPDSICVEYLYGAMKPAEKNDIMERFARNEIQVLVSTTVIEVGINVPNATVMMVENAERFGLAQLHQLRGRVGRGKHQSYCIFISASKNKEIRKRLEILNKSNDGFYIASEDLKLRGPGDLFGIRQSGILDFKIGDVFTDAKILQNASDAAGKLLEEDYDLIKNENAALKEKIDGYLMRQLTSLNI